MIGKIEKIWRYVLRHRSEQGRVEGQRVSCSLCHPSGSLKRTSSYQVDYSQVLGRMLHYVQHDNGGGISPGCDSEQRKDYAGSRFLNKLSKHILPLFAISKARHDKDRCIKSSNNKPG